MLKHRWTDRVCSIVLAVMLLATGVLMGAQSAGLIEENTALGYENRLFDQSRLHTIDIVMDDWEGFLETCTNEEYAPCTVVVDGEVYGNVGLRAKGNTSLSSVRQYGNNRYSFKVEFDQYGSGFTYHGLDKLSLNNMIQDNTYLKDYMVYTMMNKMGTAAPLCSFVRITVNGEEWGLYLAAEAVEDGFLRRNYGADHGDLYKPDSMSFGGGRGNGREFNMDDFAEQFRETMESGEDGQTEGFAFPQMGGMMPPDMSGFDPSQFSDMAPPEGNRASDSDSEDRSGRMPFGGGFGGMGSSDVRLQYTDDNPESYSNIFDNAKTDVTGADRTRLIAALKAMNGGDTSAVDTDAVMRYLAVHNFVCNDDSYTGMMVHNYYLYEEDGVLSMIPWDYNLAMGAFSMGGFGGMGGGATGTVNSPIDSPVSGGDMASRPMVAWIFEDDETIARYHGIYDALIADLFESGWFEETVTAVSGMIAPYVESDPTKFCTYEQFLAAVEALKAFGALRAESVRGQLDGTIPSTSEGQSADRDSLVDASGLNLNDMGEFGMGGGFGGMGGGSRSRNGSGGRNGSPDRSTQSDGKTSATAEAPAAPVKPSEGDAFEDAQPEADIGPAATDEPRTSDNSPDAGSMPEGAAPSDMDGTPEGMTPPGMSGMPEGMSPPGMPEGMTPPDMGEFPGGMSFPGMNEFDPSQMESFDPSQMEGFDPARMGEFPGGTGFPGMPPQAPGQ